MMGWGWGGIIPFLGTCTWTWCYARRLSCVLTHEDAATLMMGWDETGLAISSVSSAPSLMPPEVQAQLEEERKEQEECLESAMHIFFRTSNSSFNGSGDSVSCHWSLQISWRLWPLCWSQLEMLKKDDSCGGNFEELKCLFTMGFTESVNSPL